MNITRHAATHFIVLMVIVLCSLFSANTSYGNSLDGIERTIESGRVLIVFYDATGTETEKGLGLIINNEGQILTNLPLIKGAYSAEIFSETYYYDEISVLARNEEFGLALLQITAKNEKNIELDFDLEIKPDEEVYVISYQSGSDRTVTEGAIKKVSYNEKNQPEIIYTTVPVLPETSNGPLMNMAGKVIGISTADAIKDQTFYATGLGPIKSFLSGPFKAEHLHPPMSRMKSKLFIEWVETEVIGGLISFGAAKIIGVILGIIVFSFLIQWFLDKRAFRQ
jgi:hypothetical protein